MSDFTERDRRNFYNLKWLDEYMAGHKGFIAGGCFKNIFNKEKVKDIDVFFENETDFNEAKEYFDKNENYYFYYQNKKVSAYKHKQSQIAIELIKSVYGTPEEILKQFDFSITKFAYYKEIEKNVILPEDDDNPFNILPREEEIITYKIIHYKDFFEHLFLKRLVVGQDLKYPNSTFERMLRYAKYGYFPCRESKLNIISAIRNNSNVNDTLSESLYDGLD